MPHPSSFSVFSPATLDHTAIASPPLSLIDLPPPVIPPLEVAPLLPAVSPPYPLALHLVPPLSPSALPPPSSFRSLRCPLPAHCCSPPLAAIPSSPIIVSHPLTLALHPPS
ncbi:hypothetical protein AMTR_s00030p00102090 [Amborella trichopoda]|uniref:Uncharacterized protein n=1 Tax=Amborella trichopoda TaxID=13333 RepID=U5D3R4_AMBTC|nr:hypothetical protein AMTR_s00030p00102090 [Amborella trichopoda]